MKKNTGRGNKIEVHVENRPGDITKGRLKNYRYEKDIQLIAFLGHKLHRGSVRVEKKNNEYYVTERWYGISDDNEMKEYNVFFTLGHRIDDGYSTMEETSYGDRPYGEYPDNELEVNLLQDTYSEFLNNRRDNSLNFHLQIHRRKHDERLERLRTLISLESDNKLKEGYLLHLMQKETPTLRGKKLYENWCKSNPRLFTNLKNNVYNTNNPIFT